MQTFKIYTRAIITDSDGKILLLKKNSSQKYWAWNFLLPWWTLKFWEDLENALIREIIEEVNLKVKSLKIFGTKKMIYLIKI